MNNEKLVHLFRGGKLYCNTKNAFAEWGQLNDDLLMYNNGLWDYLYIFFKNNDLDNWSIEPLITKPKTVTCYKYLVKDISGSVSETIFTSLSFDDYFEDYLINFGKAPELLKTETKEVEL